MRCVPRSPVVGGRGGSPGEAARGAGGAAGGAGRARVRVHAPGHGSAEPASLRC